ncbi:hypothetical protein SteCoe_13794 [Stentor coeruleus]|uniref:RanBP2-type domain-containing protein n=1 Tax=Stentor coeruleus TaxID=5963 RepID=A0A1R2C7H5_9CILI|nr:hypothetical protein SteCoe_13794 [Stentor coeruleus]
MASLQGKIFACLNLIRTDTNYQKALSMHNKCENCINCTNPQGIYPDDLFADKSIKSILTAIINFSDQTSPEREFLLLSIVKKVTCQCGSYSGMRNLQFEEFTFQDFEDPVDIQGMIRMRNNAQFDDFCPDPGCEIKKSILKAYLENPKGGYFLSVNWQQKNLRVLSAFIKSIPSFITLNSIYKTQIGTKKYLQGMIVEGWNECLYIATQDPCSIFYKDSNDQIFLDYVLFFMIQYSLYPTLLIYNDIESNLWEEKISHWFNEITLYKNFLTNISQTSTICFYCWNQSHDYCQNFNLSNDWDCLYCSFTNPHNIIFCMNCDKFRRPSSDIDHKICRVCRQNIDNSTYCQSCSQQATCCQCSKAIYSTQMFKCSDCNNWTNSVYCTHCHKNVDTSKILCWKCINTNENKKTYNLYACPHNKEKAQCSICLYEYTCGVCFKPKVLFERSYCWKCGSELKDGICKGCCMVIPGNSYVCKECVNKNKKCLEGHIITKHSKVCCESCENESLRFCRWCCDLNHRSCDNRKFCLECFRELDAFNPGRCRINDKNHICKECEVCNSCYGMLNTCECNCKILSIETHCKKCGSDKKVKSILIPKVYCKDDRGWICRSCNYSNEANSIFCDNCNMRMHFDMENRSICHMCNGKNSMKMCDYCYRIGSCAWCRKGLMSGQGRYCANCSNLTMGRACIKCMDVVLVHEVICYMCSKSVWICSCEVTNPSWNKVCKNCNKCKQQICDICSNKFEQKKDCWRCGSVCKNVPKTINLASSFSVARDIKLCNACSIQQNFCECGSRILEIENICKTCNKEFK